MHCFKTIVYYIIARMLCLRYNHVKIKHKARVNYQSIFEGYNVICENTYFQGEMGLCSYIGQNSIVLGKIGRFCSIARNVTFIESAHPTKGWISTHPAFYSVASQCGITFTNKQRFEEHPKIQGSKYSFEIGNDVFIGAGATLIGPVKIGDGVIIAANAIVTRDIEPYSVVAGNPARIIRKRFCEDEIDYLEKLKWWDKDIEWLSRNYDAFISMGMLKDRVGEIF